MTSRDYEIIEFVKKFGIASTSTIQQEFFPSLSACQKRLKTISDSNGLKRSRNIVSAEYVYFSHRPKQFRHSLLVSDFYREMSRFAAIPVFNIEPTYGDIRPDASFGYELNNKKYLGLLEVEISNKGFDSFKYKKLFANDNYKNFFPVMPTVFLVSDNVKLFNYPFNVVQINTDFSNLPLRLGIRLVSVCPPYGKEVQYG